MTDRVTRITLRARDLPAYRAAVVDCASAEEREACERFLGHLASLEAGAADGSLVTFTPPPGCVDLALRARNVLAQRLVKKRPPRRPGARPFRRERKRTPADDASRQAA